MINLLQLVKCLFISLLMAAVLIPILKKIAVKLNLVDMPAKRKVHLQPIPLIGGIAIALSAGFSLVLSPYLPQLIINYTGLFICSSVLFIVGILDDKFDIKAVLKLLIQLACSYTLASQTIRLTSLYGLFNIYQISEPTQLILTTILITGIVNAFNLMDGVDGLAGGLSLLGFCMLLIIGFICNNVLLCAICCAFIGAIIMFLKHNIATKKIFMGDSGSLFLGFILVSLSINTLEHPGNISALQHEGILLSTVAFFAIPTLDSLRVYRRRMKNGGSPFKADKTHLHHILLSTGLKHKRITLLIVMFSGSLILLALGAKKILTLSIVLLIISLIYILFTNLFYSFSKMKLWNEKIKQIEL